MHELGQLRQHFLRGYVIFGLFKDGGTLADFDHAYLLMRFLA
jgi:hypothetical protein